MVQRKKNIIWKKTHFFYSFMKLTWTYLSCLFVQADSGGPVMCEQGGSWLRAAVLVGNKSTNQDWNNSSSTAATNIPTTTPAHLLFFFFHLLFFSACEILDANYFLSKIKGVKLSYRDNMDICICFIMICIQYNYKICEISYIILTNWRLFLWMSVQWDPQVPLIML